MPVKAERPRRVYFRTFGCRTNQYDTERIRQLLERRGCETVADLREADACVVNSCTVTRNADSQLRRFVRRVQRRSGGRVPVVVAGCAAAVGAEVIASLEGVTTVVRGQDPEAVANGLGVFPRNADELGVTVLERNERGTRAWLKVQDGCDLRCSYCAIKIARGRSRSRSVDEIVDEASHLARHHPEISLTGIHIGLYGKDRKPRTSLSTMIETLLERVDDVRFRIGSLECNQLDEKIIEIMRSAAGRLAPHLHVPLQSGSNDVLRAMRRPYPRERYIARVARLSQRVRPLGLGTDVIVGFPGETEQDHDLTVQIIERLPFTYVHAFPYSRREGTDALELPDRVSPEVKQVRSKQIRDIVSAKAAAHRSARIGTGAQVVLEGDDRGTAVTGDYLKLQADDSLKRRGPRLQDARIVMGDDGGLLATAIE